MDRSPTQNPPALLQHKPPFTLGRRNQNVQKQGPGQAQRQLHYIEVGGQGCQATSLGESRHAEHKVNRRKHCKGRAIGYHGFEARRSERETPVRGLDAPTQTSLDSSPEMASGCGLNSKFWAINGQTVRENGVQHCPDGSNTNTDRPSSYPGCLPNLICCQTFLIASEARIADQLSRKYLTCTYTVWD